MPVKVKLVENNFDKGGPVIARVVRGETVSYDDLLEYMAMNTALEVNDMKVSMAQFYNALLYFLPKGDVIDTPIGKFRLGVRSKKGGSDGSGVDQNGRPAVKDISLLYNFESTNGQGEEKLPNTIAAGDLVHVNGENLSFRKDDEECGLFLVAKDQSQTVRFTVLSSVGGKNIDGKVPAVAPGTYYLEARTRPTKTDVRTGRLKEVVTGVCVLSN